MTKRITKIFVHLIILFSILAYSNIAYAQQKRIEENHQTTTYLTYSQSEHTVGIIDRTFNLGFGYRNITKNKFAHSFSLFLNFTNYNIENPENAISLLHTNPKSNNSKNPTLLDSNYFVGGLGMEYSINYQLLPRRSRFQIGIGAKIAANLGLGGSKDENSKTQEENEYIFAPPHYYELGPNIEFTYFFSKKGGNAIQFGYSPLLKHRLSHDSYKILIPASEESSFINQFRINFIYNFNYKDQRVYKRR